MHKQQQETQALNFTLFGSSSEQQQQKKINRASSTFLRGDVP
jgi:hypothetical protein